MPSGASKVWLALAALAVLASSVAAKPPVPASLTARTYDRRHARAAHRGLDTAASTSGSEEDAPEVPANQFNKKDMSHQLSEYMTQYRNAAYSVIWFSSLAMAYAPPAPGPRCTPPSSDRAVLAGYSFRHGGSICARDQRRGSGRPAFRRCACERRILCTEVTRTMWPRVATYVGW
jgi:hypothetical protein